MSPELDRLLAGLAEGTLSKEDQDRLRQRLDEDPGARRALVDAWCFDSALGAELSARRKAEASARRQAQRPRWSRGRHRSWRASSWWVAGMATAAAVLVILTLVPRWSEDPDRVPRVMSGLLEGDWTTLKEDTPLRPGIWRCSGPSRLGYADGSELVLGDQSVVQWMDGMDLLSGEMECSIAAQDPGRVFSISIPHGQIQVRGTRFRIIAEPGQSRVMVAEGRVDVSDGLGGIAMATAGTQVDLHPGIHPKARRWWRSGEERRALLLTSGEPPPPDDAGLIRLLGEAGYRVDVADIATAPRTRMEGAAVVVVSSSSALPHLFERWAPFDDVPILSFEIGSAALFAMEPGDEKESVDRDALLFRSRPGHPLSQPGETAVAMRGAELALAKASSLAVWTTGSRGLVYAADAGMPLLDGSICPQRRIVIGIRTTAFSRLTPAGRTLVLECLAWISG